MVVPYNEFLAGELRNRAQAMARNPAQWVQRVDLSWP